jgi:hypothetical protein
VQLLRRRFALRDVETARDEVQRAAVVADHRLVRPRDQAASPVARQPMTDLRARLSGRPHVREHFAESAGLLGRDDELTCVRADHLLAGEAGRALAGVVEHEDATVGVEHADERLRRLGERGGEGVELTQAGKRTVGGSGHPSSVATSFSAATTPQDALPSRETRACTGGAIQRVPYSFEHV